MRFSRYFLPTLKEVPQEAHLVSHQLMLRCCMIHQVAAGLYAWAPLGLKVLQKIEAIIREEHAAIDALEVHMPTIQPAALWKESGRYEDYGKELLRFKDRHEVELLYGPTCEEIFTQFFKTHIKSYKDLPQRLYQIQLKFRDEIRPRFGVMRGREFLMKDLYSFDLNKAASLQSYEAVLGAYYKIFERMNLKALAVRADTGPIGGDLSHEFIVLAPSGESTLLYDATFKPGTPLTLDDIHNVYAVTDDQHNPETCPLKADQLETSKGIEVGHVFYFGTKYSAPLGASVMDDKGELTPVHMGSYGIGVSRVLAALIEIFSDEKGMVWPQSVAPFDVGLVNLKRGDEACTAMADALYTKLKAAGIDVLYDDRDRPAGFKLNDMDLVGLPYQIILGPKNAAKGHVELKERATGKLICLSQEALMAKISATDGLAKLSSLFDAAQCA